MTNEFTGCLLCGDGRALLGILCQQHQDRYLLESGTRFEEHTAACIRAWLAGQRSSWPRPFVEEAPAAATKPVMAADANGRLPARCLNCGGDKDGECFMDHDCWEGLGGASSNWRMADEWLEGARDFPRRAWAKPAAPPPRETVAPRRKLVDPARPYTFVGTRWQVWHKIGAVRPGQEFVVMGVSGSDVLCRYTDGWETAYGVKLHVIADRLDDAPEAATPTVYFGIDEGRGEHIFHRCTGCEWFMDMTCMSEAEITAAVHGHLKSDHTPPAGLTSPIAREESLGARWVRACLMCGRLKAANHRCPLDYEPAAMKPAPRGALKMLPHVPGTCALPTAPTLGTCGALGNVHTKGDNDPGGDYPNRRLCLMGLSCPTHGVREVTREPWRSSVDELHWLPDVDVRR
jgi:hypothetical protein